MAFMLLLTLIGACGKDKNSTSPDNNSNVPAELLGTWNYQSATINGVPISLALILQWEVGTVAARFTVYEDGSLTNEELNDNGEVVWTEHGTITVSGDSATIALTSDNDGPINPPDTLSGTWQLDAGDLVLTTTYNEATVVLIATR